MATQMSEGEALARGLTLLVAVAVAFALGVELSGGAALVLGTSVAGVLGWRLFGQDASPAQRRLAAGVALGLALVTIWAS
ncbi:MAG TPA: hypothetical protein VFM09_01815 [Marmoricola sp.]|nr:hypothetical protein [Marmoricola sp.]